MSEETELESVQRLETIFNRLDRSGNGRIDIQDLSTALKDFGMSLHYAEVTLTFTFTTSHRLSLHIYFHLYFPLYFILFLFTSHSNRNSWGNRITTRAEMWASKNSSIMFASMRKICSSNFPIWIKIKMVMIWPLVRTNQSHSHITHSAFSRFFFYALILGMVDLEEIILAFKELGIDIDRKEATKLLERYDIAHIRHTSYILYIQTYVNPQKHSNSISGSHWFYYHMTFVVRLCKQRMHFIIQFYFIFC